MLKTKKYWMQIESAEVDLTDYIEISAEIYWNEMKKWDKIIEETKDNENVGQATKHSLIPQKKEHATRYIDYLNVGCSSVILIREELDEGYNYVPKSRSKKKSSE